MSQDQLRDTAVKAITTLDDLLNIYASEFCDPARVKEAHRRIENCGGTIAYITDATSALRAALTATQQAADGEQPIGPADLRRAIDSVTGRNQLTGSAADIKQAAPSDRTMEISSAVLAALDALGDDAAVHIHPDTLAKCSRSECVVKVVSVRLTDVETGVKYLPLFSREQVAAALIEASEQPAAIKPDEQLCKFYGVTTYADLVAAQAHHIEKLQAKLPPLRDEQAGEARSA